MYKKNIFFDLAELVTQYIEKVNILSIPEIQNVDYHLVQSFYAKQHLKNKGINKLFFLSDYINKNFFKRNPDNLKKENIVLYNPKKGLNFTSKLIKKTNDIKFIPIENMSRNEVISLMKKAKVYIDFGFHPGKDRLPREAAICNCCIIVGKKGSAKFQEDVPIPEEFKFERKVSNIPNILNKIKECLYNYETNVEKFRDYRSYIKKEYENFKKDLKNIFQIKDENENLSVYNSKE